MTSKRLAILPTVLLVVSLGALAVPAAAGARSQAGRRADRTSHAVRFYATVLRASRRGIVVRTLSGRTLRFSAGRIARERAPLARHRRGHGRGSQHRPGMHFAFMAVDVPPPAAPVAIDIPGLQPGVVLLITETVGGDRRRTVEITLPPSNVTVRQTDSGVITDAEGDSFQIIDRGGAPLRFDVNRGRLSKLTLEECERVDVTYHQYGSLLIADRVHATGVSAPAACTHTSAATGIEYAEQYASGRVIAVSSRSVTVVDSDTGRSETFVADPSRGPELCTYAFDGVHVGDQIDVTYHQSATGMIADSVSDPGASS